MAQSPQLKHSSPTSPDPQDFRLDATPAMRADNVVSGDHWRIGLITDSLVRFEWSDSGVFENRPTQTILNRDFGSPVERRVTERDGRVIIDTAALTIVYDQQPFSKEGLSVVVKGVADTQFNTWHYGDAQRGNLKGTARTLDEADGAIELDNGVISRDGWAVIDDSAANIIIETDTVNGKANPFGTWVSPRATAETDLYFFGYGHRYIEAVRDFYRLTGPTPLLPRFAMGNWWSRYYRYTQDGYLALMDRFKREGIPFTTSVIDMDWHRVDDVDPKYGSGWTGYSWNRELFPDPPAFLADLHRRGLRTTLNVHPRDGVRAFEDAYPEVAKRVGIDPATEENVEFDLTNPDFVDAYFDMHHRMEAEGVDFWWLDWQQGMFDPKMKNLSNTWWINYAFFSDMEKRRETRPMLYHRWGGLGNHRYQVGFSGDAVISWKSLDFQPYFNSTASNVLYGYWSHDLGGHIGSQIDPEMYTRWLQFGALSPIMRTHSQKGAKLNKEPWVFNKEYCDIIRETIRQRYVMAPYIYTMARKGYDDGISLCRPMYYDYPENKEAYEFRNEYMFGDDVLVMPVTAPVENDYAQVRVWLPEGEWYEWHTGALLKGNQIVERSFAVDEYPIYIKAGAILPMYLDNVMNLNGNDEEMAVTVFPGGGDTAEFKLYEDNGNDKNYASEYAVTKLSSVRNGNEQTLVIGKREGAYKDMPLVRPFKVKVLSSLIPQSVTVNGHPAKYQYSGEDFALLIDVPAQACDQEKVVKIVYPSEKVDLNGLLGASRRIAKSMEQLKYRNSYIVFKEEFGKMGSLSEAVTYAPSEMPALIADFWKSYNELPAVLERQGMKSDLATWFLQSVCWSKR